MNSEGYEDQLSTYIPGSFNYNIVYEKSNRQTSKTTEEKRLFEKKLDLVVNNVLKESNIFNQKDKIKDQIRIILNIVDDNVEILNFNVHVLSMVLIYLGEYFDIDVDDFPKIKDNLIVYANPEENQNNDDKIFRIDRHKNLNTEIFYSNFVDPIFDNMSNVKKKAFTSEQKKYARLYVAGIFVKYFYWVVLKAN